MYNELSKEAKKQLINKYVGTKKGKALSDTLNRLLLEGLVLIVCFVIVLVAIFVADLASWYWIVAILSLIFGLVFLIGQHLLRMKEYNKFFNQLNKTEKNKLTKLK